MIPTLILLALLLALPGVDALGQYLPDEALGKFEIEAGFRIEIFAAEPFVVDPVAIAFDERGRIYCCEMREMEVLPATEPGKKGMIRMLTDNDGDGRVDHATPFATRLSFPSGIACSNGGVYALCTPDLLYLRDANNDGLAEEMRVVMTGFGQGNAEWRFNNLKWGMDNWIHAANGHGGGQIYDPWIEEAERWLRIDLTNRDLRFRPLGDPAVAIFQSESRQIGGGFGLAFDEWDRRYVNQNEMHAIQVVVPERYLERNPELSVGRISEDISDHGKPDAKVYPASKPQKWRVRRTEQRAKNEAAKFRPTQLEASGYFTAACGALVYRGNLFPKEYQGNLFVCDAAQNLIHRDLLKESGAGMVASRAQEGTEFLRSTDGWFRPVNLTEGPDGAIYVVDFCREIIETAASIPPDILEDLELTAGNTMGRIWRITPQSRYQPFHPHLLDTLKNGRLVERLARDNAWEQETAQRLLIERNAVDVIPELKILAREGADPKFRVRALWTLEGLGALDEAVVLAALDDEHPRVREHAVRLSEQLLTRLR